ncbi:MAG: type II toxin-antitoxin system RelE/ParE family toxin [Chthonomonadaceae bacterium]|nr:type II toxin-antitoxin system RelE/ParE family toxin [Chthonomonadaceae bacterium]
MDVLKLILDNESCPFDEWLEGLRDVVGKARIIRQVDKIERGLFGDWKSVGEGVFELRLNFGPGYRVYYGREGETIVILLGGSDKGHQRVAIETAHRHWRDYLQSDQASRVILRWQEEAITEEEE